MIEILKADSIIDHRGELIPIEFEKIFAFRPVRFFYIKDVPDGTMRGGHAHRNTIQVYVVIQGKINVVVYREKLNETSLKGDVFSLTKNQMCLIPAMTWTEEWFNEPGTILGVFCSHPYNQFEYIRDFEEYKTIYL
ncbi:MAG: FdtA/QdtA family cupin domain-containing protein [Candidatus Nanoarchaeia archaeon]|nr:FdtA/QdtA family cupin domain-containing protein [Candidatus Nanoarchaeia archaeon]